MAAALLAACVDDAAPPAAGMPESSSSTVAPPPVPTAATATVSPDTSAYDAKPAVPIGTTPNTVAAETQQASMPPPLPPAGSTGRSNTVGGIAYPVVATFVPGYPTIIEVEIRDKQAADAVSLVAPGGAEAAAYQMDETRQVSLPDDDSGMNVGVAVAGGSSGGVRTGIGFGFPLFGSAAPPKPETEVLTRARLRIADPAAYRADWQHWVIRILFDTGKPTARKMEIAAPRPPAS